MKLAIAQMVLGILIVANYFLMGLELFVLSLFPFWGWLSLPLQLVLGLAVLGCGIAQFLKARKVRIRHEATP